MVKANQNIELVNQNDIEDSNTFHLVNCIIDTIDLIGVFGLKTHVVIENCVINNLRIHSCWFVNGLVLKNSIINNYIDYQMGGHNGAPIIIDGNIFLDFFNFFDCQFDNIVEFKNNILIKGTNFIGNKGEGFENKFQKGYIIENNIGILDLNE